MNCSCASVSFLTYWNSAKNASLNTSHFLAFFGLYAWSSSIQVLAVPVRICVKLLIAMCCVQFPLVIHCSKFLMRVLTSVDDFAFPSKYPVSVFHDEPKSTCATVPWGKEKTRDVSTSIGSRRDLSILNLSAAILSAACLFAASCAAILSAACLFAASCAAKFCAAASCAASCAANCCAASCAACSAAACCCCAALLAAIS